MSTAASRTLVLILAAAGLAAAGTSTWVHYRLLTVPDFTSFCDVNATVSCTQAYLSPYGELAGVPVAIFGAIYFAVVIAIAAIDWRPSKTPPGAPAWILAISLPALAFVAYLAFAAFFILNAFCILCAITYVAVIGITLVTWRGPRITLGQLASRASGDLAAAVRRPLVLAIAVILIAGTIAVVRTFPDGNVAAAAPATVEALPVVPDAERAKLAQWWEVQPKEILPIDGGGAKVVVVKFNDYQCPLCGLTYNAYKPVLQRHAGAVRAITKHYPLENECNPGISGGGGHLAACEAAAAVIMARAKGTVDKLEEWLFSHQGPPQLTPDQVKAAARDVAGITDFDAQYATVLKEVQADAILGEKLKVNSTPTFFINGRRLPQAVAAQYLNVLLEIELNRP